MEIIKLMTNGIPQGVYAITKKEEVTDQLLDMMNNVVGDKEFLKYVLFKHLKEGLAVIPPGSEVFDWNQEIHGEF